MYSVKKGQNSPTYSFGSLLEVQPQYSIPYKFIILKIFLLPIQNLTINKNII